eukprot:bmy_16155T0
MASQEEQAVKKNLSMENANQENEKKDEKEQDANKREPLALPLEAEKIVTNLLYEEEKLAKHKSTESITFTHKQIKGDPSSPAEILLIAAVKFSNNGFPLQLELPLAAIPFYTYFSKELNCNLQCSNNSPQSFGQEAYHKLSVRNVINTSATKVTKRQMTAQKEEHRTLFESYDIKDIDKLYNENHECTKKTEAPLCRKRQEFDVEICTKWTEEVIRKQVHTSSTRDGLSLGMKPCTSLTRHLTQ